MSVIGANAKFYSTFVHYRVALQYEQRHKTPTTKVFLVPHRATIAVLPNPADAVGFTRVMASGLLITSVVLLPLNQAVWMLAT